MEGVTLEQFKKFKPFNIPVAQFNSHLSDENDQDDSTSTTHLHIIFQFILTKK